MKSASQEGALDSPKSSTRSVKRPGKGPNQQVSLGMVQREKTAAVFFQLCCDLRSHLPPPPLGQQQSLGFPHPSIFFLKTT